MVVIGSVVVVSEGGVVGDGIEGRVNGRAAVNLQWGCGEMGAWGCDSLERWRCGD